jgi:hypothetical protein
LEVRHLKRGYSIERCIKFFDHRVQALIRDLWRLAKLMINPSSFRLRRPCISITAFSRNYRDRRIASNIILTYPAMLIPSFVGLSAPTVPILLAPE